MKTRRAAARDEQVAGTAREDEPPSTLHKPRPDEEAQRPVFVPIRRSDRRPDAGPFTKVLTVLFLAAFSAGFGVPALLASDRSPESILWNAGLPAAIGLIAGIAIVSKWRKE